MNLVRILLECSSEVMRVVSASLILLQKVMTGYAKQVEWIVLVGSMCLLNGTSSGIS